MNGKYVLIASDDSALKEKIEKEFKDTNIIFTYAPDSRLAMEMIAAKEYDAAIVDVDLTSVSSYDFLYRLNILRHSMPIIAISSVLTADNIILAYDFGVVELMDKKFIDGELAALINNKVLNVVI